MFYKIAPRLPKMFREKAEVMKDKDYEKARDPNSAATEEEEEEAEEAAAHKNANFITRVSLRLLLPTWKDIVRKLFTPLEIVEPTYKDIITLYRCAPLSHTAGAASVAPVAHPPPRQQPLTDRHHAWTASTTRSCLACVPGDTHSTQRCCACRAAPCGVFVPIWL